VRSSPRALNANGRDLLHRLRVLRDKAGLTQEQAGERLGWSRYQVWRMENVRLPEYRVLREAMDVYEVPAEEQDVYLKLWEEARSRD
jgi:transcriptional regulator with XRE-family HTH domain